ncbi:hypothetical protein [Priestia megaterium]|uniref:hypothetical protein n=1 Tax=Priestia megaterium TaxID=1404 RepID=UPI001A93F511|nr:hypothetical protein [Priestia megaterium]QSX24068.1 hypothetical protein J0P05_31050 [Priestia megaterium]
MDSKGQLVAQELNQEWVKLIKEASHSWGRVVSWFKLFIAIFLLYNLSYYKTN